ncbi:MAG: single-stranded DNA-binding protein [Flavobacteriaceae bacterium]|nr:single-stranded DNA-binding protein [Flavobacteriaceae bacterium]
MPGFLNKVMLIGYVGKGVDLHYFEKGKCVGRFSMATNESYISKKTGEKVTNTQWYTIAVNNALAEMCEKYLNKGDQIYCEGKLSIKTKEQNSVESTTVEIIAKTITFLSKKDNSKN